MTTTIDRTSQVALGLTFLGGHIWHAFRAKIKDNTPEQKDYLAAAIAGFAFLFVTSTAFKSHTEQI